MQNASPGHRRAGSPKGRAAVSFGPVSQPMQPCRDNLPSEPVRLRLQAVTSVYLIAYGFGWRTAHKKRVMCINIYIHVGNDCSPTVRRKRKQTSFEMS